MAGGKWRVLVVDDEPDLRELICMTLRFDGRLDVVSSVGSAEEALATATGSTESPDGPGGGDATIDLVVLDHWLGGPLTGLDVAAALRGRWPDVRVVLFTALDDVEIDLRDGAVDAVLSKPELDRLPEVALHVMSRDPR